MSLLWRLAGLAVPCLLALHLPAAVPGERAAQPPTGADAPGPGDCPIETLEYALAARLRLEDTPFGAGDGVYDIGPGKITLRIWKASTPDAAARVELSSYEMRDHFVVSSHVLFLRATVANRTDTRAAGGRGTLRGRELSWTTPVQDYRADGTIECKGSGCGLPGAPPSGKSQIHIGPGPVRFAPFVFDSPNLDTFRMAFTKVAHTDVPKQTAFVTLAGRKMSRRPSSGGCMNGG
jgi:hypothetical protein